MKIRVLLIGLLLTGILSSCKKDLATDWVGTYTGVAGNSTVNRVVVSKVNDETIKMELQTLVLGTYYTYATVANGKLANANTVNISEDGTVSSSPGNVYHFSGAGTRNGNNLVLSGMAQNKNNASDILYYTFNGNK